MSNTSNNKYTVKGDLIFDQNNVEVARFHRAHDNLELQSSNIKNDEYNEIIAAWNERGGGGKRQAAWFKPGEANIATGDYTKRHSYVLDATVGRGANGAVGIEKEFNKNIRTNIFSEDKPLFQFSDNKSKVLANVTNEFANSNHFKQFQKDMNEQLKISGANNETVDKMNEMFAAKYNEYLKEVGAKEFKASEAYDQVLKNGGSHNQAAQAAKVTKQIQHALELESRGENADDMIIYGYGGAAHVTTWKNIKHSLNSNYKTTNPSYDELHVAYETAQNTRAGRQSVQGLNYTDVFDDKGNVKNQEVFDHLKKHAVKAGDGSDMLFNTETSHSTDGAVTRGVNAAFNKEFKDRGLYAGGNFGDAVLGQVSRVIRSAKNSSIIGTAASGLAAGIHGSSLDDLENSLAIAEDGTDYMADYDASGAKWLNATSSTIGFGLGLVGDGLLTKGAGTVAKAGATGIANSAKAIQLASELGKKGQTLAQAGVQTTKVAGTVASLAEKTGQIDKIANGISRLNKLNNGLRSTIATSKVAGAVDKLNKSTSVGGKLTKATVNVAGAFVEDMTQEMVKSNVQQMFGNKNSFYAKNPDQYVKDYQAVFNMSIDNPAKAGLKLLAGLDVLGKAKVGLKAFDWYRKAEMKSTIRHAKMAYAFGNSKAGRWIHKVNPFGATDAVYSNRQLQRSVIANADSKLYNADFEQSLSAAKAIDMMSNDPQGVANKAVTGANKFSGATELDQQLNDFLQNHKSLGKRIDVEQNTKKSTIADGLAKNKQEPKVNIMSDDTIRKIELINETEEISGRYQKELAKLNGKDGVKADDIEKLEMKFKDDMAKVKNELDELGGADNSILELYDLLVKRTQASRRTEVLLGMADETNFNRLMNDKEYAAKIFRQEWQEAKTGVDSLDTGALRGGQTLNTDGLSKRRKGASKDNPAMDPITAIQQRDKLIEKEYIKTIAKDLGRLKEIYEGTNPLKGVKYEDGANVFTGTVLDPNGVSNRAKRLYNMNNDVIADEVLDNVVKAGAENVPVEVAVGAEPDLDSVMKYTIRNSADELIANKMQHGGMSFDEAIKSFTTDNAYSEQVFQKVMERQVLETQKMLDADDMLAPTDALKVNSVADYGLKQYRTLTNDSIKFYDSEIANLQKKIVGKQADKVTTEINQIKELEQLRKQEVVKLAVSKKGFGNYSDRMKVFTNKTFKAEEKLANIRNQHNSVVDELARVTDLYDNGVKKITQDKLAIGKALKVIGQKKPATPERIGWAYATLKEIGDEKFNKYMNKFIDPNTKTLSPEYARNVLPKYVNRATANKIKGLTQTTERMTKELNDQADELLKKADRLAEQTKKNANNEIRVASQKLDFDGDTPKAFKDGQGLEQFADMVKDADKQVEDIEKAIRESTSADGLEKIEKLSDDLAEAIKFRNTVYDNVAKIIDDDIESLKSLKNKAVEVASDPEVAREVRHNIHKEMGRQKKYFEAMSKEDFMANRIAKNYEKDILGDLFDDQDIKYSNLDKILDAEAVKASEDDMLKLIKNQMSSGDDLKLGKFSKAMRFMSSSFRIFTTSLFPGAIPRNASRDSIQSFVLTDTSAGVLGSVGKFMKNKPNYSLMNLNDFTESMKKNFYMNDEQAYKAFVAMKSNDANLFRHSANNAFGEINEQISGKGVVDWLKSEGVERATGKTYIQRLRDGGVQNIKEVAFTTLTKPADFVESMTRSTNFMGYLEAAFDEARIRGTDITDEFVSRTIRDADWHARNITTDFSRKFKMTKNYAKSASYLNSAFAGAESFRRLFEMNPLGTSINITTKLIGPALYFWAYNNSDERKAAYDQLPNYIKDNNLVFLNKTGIDSNGKPTYSMVTAPLPQELANFQTMLHEVLRGGDEAPLRFLSEFAATSMPLDFNGFFKNQVEEINGEEPDLAERLFRGFGGIAASVLPDVGRVAVENLTGKDLYTGNTLYKTPGKTISKWFGVKDDSDDKNAALIHNTMQAFLGSFTDPIINLIDTMAGVKEDERGGASLFAKSGESLFGTVSQSKSNGRINGVKNYHLSNTAYYTGINNLQEEKEQVEKDLKELDKKKLDHERDSDGWKAVEEEQNKVRQAFGRKVKNFIEHWHSEFKNNKLYSYTDKEEGALLRLLNFMGENTSLSNDKILNEKISEAELNARNVVWKEYLSLGLPTKPSDKNVYKNSLSDLKGASYRMADEVEYLIKQKVKGTDKTIRQIHSEYKSKIIEANKAKNYDESARLTDEYTENYLLPLMQGLAFKYTAQGIAKSSPVRDILADITLVPFEYTRTNSAGKKVFQKSNDKMNRNAAYVDSYLKNLWKNYEKDVKYDTFNSDSRAKYNLDKIKALKESGDLTGARAAAKQLKRRVNAGEMALTASDYESLNF